MSKLLELADRVEALTGPDREVDARIWCALHGKRYQGHYRAYAAYGTDNPLTQVEFTEPPKRTRLVTDGARTPHAQPYTTLIDAAMALVPEAISGHMTMPSVGRYTPELWQAGIHVPGPRLKSPIAYAKTPALALCAAALRARHAVEGEPLP